MWFVARTEETAVIAPVLTEPVVGSLVCHSITAVADVIDLNKGPLMMMGATVSLKGRTKLCLLLVVLIFKPLTVEITKLEASDGVTVIEYPESLTELGKTQAE